MRNTLPCLAVVLASLSAICTGALAAEAGPATEKLEQAIARLRRDYLAKLDSGDEDHELRNLVRDLNAARGKGDWNRVAALLSARGIDLDAADDAAGFDADSTGDAPVVAEGTHDNPNVTITVSAEDFVAIKTGELNGQMAFMQGKLKIAGDMGLAMKLQKLLG